MDEKRAFEEKLEQMIRHQESAPRLSTGEFYWDKKRNEPVEFGYMGQTGYAIVYEPGDSGAGMQSSWGVKPDDLEELSWETKEKIRRAYRI